MVKMSPIDNLYTHNKLGHLIDEKRTQELNGLFEFAAVCCSITHSQSDTSHTTLSHLMRYPLTANQSVVSFQFQRPYTTQTHNTAFRRQRNSIYIVMGSYSE